MDSKLCGFIFCHGDKDFSVWEGQFPEEVLERIEEILIEYDTIGTSTRNAYDLPLSELVSDVY